MKRLILGLVAGGLLSLWALPAQAHVIYYNCDGMGNCWPAGWHYGCAVEGHFQAEWVWWCGGRGSA